MVPFCPRRAASRHSFRRERGILSLSFFFLSVSLSFFFLQTETKKKKVARHKKQRKKAEQKKQKTALSFFVVVLLFRRLYIKNHSSIAQNPLSLILARKCLQANAKQKLCSVLLFRSSKSNPFLKSKATSSFLSPFLFFACPFLLVPIIQLHLVARENGERS